MAVDIPNYRVIEKLGVGAQTRIFRARSMRDGKDYTVKIVKVVKPEQAGFIDLLRAELAIGSAIDHPVIRKVYELRMLRYRLRVRGAILFMEYVNGMSMGDKDFRHSIPEILGFFTQVAEGLNAMHRAGYVHADLKPSNIMVTAEGEVKLIDLGQSAEIHEAKPRVQGTIDYMAPEQVQRGLLDERTDVFGLGAALHKVLTGKPIETEMNKTISMNAQSLVGKRIPSAQESKPRDLPVCVTRLLEECCRSDPDDRLADMLSVLRRLELAQTILTKPASKASSADQEQDDRWPERDEPVEALEPKDVGDDTIPAK